MPPEMLELISVTANGVWNNYDLTFPNVTISWRLPKHVPPTPFGIDWSKLGTGKDLILLCDVTFTRGRHSVTAKAGFQYDGASIPWIIRWAPGYERIGRHLWAATFHDWILEHLREEGFTRVLADAWFITLLLDTGVRKSQSRWMYRAVRLHSLRCEWRSDAEGVVSTATDRASADLSEKAMAMDSAFAKAMLESHLADESADATE
jgi:hypothetical protein